MPATVKVGPFDFPIEQWSRKDMKAENRYGETDFEAFAIRITVEGLPRQVIAETLIHEIMHAVCFIWNREAAADEESTVTKMAHGMATVLRDNPAIADFLTASLR